jgi:hypothetical protein
MSKPLPRYKCHKQVCAAKIAGVDAGVDQFQDAWILTFTDPDLLPMEVDDDFMRRHKPSIGQYLVVYDDGYKSVSPAKAFEEGYTLI